ncbi:MAG TPA: ASCH domain-containing protein [Acidimicrobiales bacterium]|nr:ASCH domain-containing protein [Acidimicrobiales bacterium]
MKALTLHEPWATDVAEGRKRIETRGWSTRYRGPLAIHAARTLRSVEYLGWLERHLGEPDAELAAYAGRVSFATTRRGNTRVTRHPFSLGCVIATCELVDVVPIVVAGSDRLVPERAAPPCVAPSASGRDLVAHWAWDDESGDADVRYFAERSHGDYRAGRFAWLLDNVQPLSEPIAVAGKQGLWECGDAVNFTAVGSDA